MTAAEYDPTATPDPRYELEESVDYSQFITAIPLMVRMARRGANNEAISYRQFHVGASAYAVKYEGERLPMVIGGANYKPDKETEKYCAEMDVLDQAAEDGYDEILGVVIAGTTEPEAIRSVMSRVTPTLHPCDACQDKMEKSPLVTPDTLIVTVGLDCDTVQIHTFSDLKTIYELEENEGASIMSPAVSLDLDNWERKERAFDTMTQEDADRDPAQIARLVLLSAFDVDD